MAGVEEMESEEWEYLAVPRTENKPVRDVRDKNFAIVQARQCSNLDKNGIRCKFKIFLNPPCYEGELQFTFAERKILAHMLTCPGGKINENA